MKDWPTPGFQYVNLTEAEGALVPCDDVRCLGDCQGPHDGMFCSHHGGTCIHHPTPGHDEVCAFVWKYGDGSSASGVLFQSQISLEGIMVNSTYGGITNITGSFFEAPKGGGIMGMSFGLHHMCKKRKFSTCLTPCSMTSFPKLAICRTNFPSAPIVMPGS